MKETKNTKIKELKKAISMIENNLIYHVVIVVPHWKKELRRLNNQLRRLQSKK